MLNYQPSDMSDQILYTFPPYIDDIIERLKACDWFVHNFNCDDDGEDYNPANYLYNADYENTKYVVVLDLNVFQFILNIVKKKQPHPKYRDAASLLIFCQYSNIQIEPAFCIYEKINHNELKLDESLSDLELFHCINNGDTDDLAKYALGYVDSVSIPLTYDIDKQKIEKDLLEHEKLTGWDSIYLIVLSIVNIHIDESILRQNKIIEFSSWMLLKFRKSLACSIYAIILFGSCPAKGMMKYNKSKSPEDRKNAVINMTWDLYIMSQFFERWVQQNSDDEFMYVSDDKAFRSLLREIVDVQKRMSFEPIRKYLSDTEYSAVQAIINDDRESSDRVYGSKKWTSEYRVRLILEYEAKLYGKKNSINKNFCV